MKYKASLDNLAKVMTIGITVVFVVVIAKQIEAIKQEPTPMPFLVIGGSILLYNGALLFRPLNYRVTDKHIIVHRPLKDLYIDRNTITSIEKIDDATLQKSIRTIGVGGLFGYFGKYANRKNGSMTWYATRRSRAVMICTNNNKKIVLTPDTPEAFIMALHK